MMAGGVWTGAAAALYVAGYFVQATWIREGVSRTDLVNVGEGYVLVYTYSRPAIAGAAPGRSLTLTKRREVPSAFTGYRWWFERRERPGGMAYVVPLWAVALPGIAAAGLGWWRRCAVRRGSCPKCGYDVRGLTHAACPGCGRTLGV